MSKRDAKVNVFNFRNSIVSFRSLINYNINVSNQDNNGNGVELRINFVGRVDYLIWKIKIKSALAKYDNMLFKVDTNLLIVCFVICLLLCVSISGIESNFKFGDYWASS